MRVYSGTNDNDIINARSLNDGFFGQTHIYARAGDDRINLIFDTEPWFDTSPNWRITHGHHARGDQDGENDRGADIFNFVGISNIPAGKTSVGRLEDFDPSYDQIWIEGVPLDLYNLPSNVRIVEHKGDHNDPGALPQQWLLITNSNGGQIFYALEGARIDMDPTEEGGSGSTQPDGSKHEEAHFIKTLPADFSALKDVAYIDPQNYVPAGMTADGGITINDDDNNRPDVTEPIQGSASGDLIATGLNDDLANGWGGNDKIWGGSGNDTLGGSVGNDTIWGGTGNDRILGGDDNDTLHGSYGQDNIFGDAGDDFLWGQTDDDSLSGGIGNDTLWGGDGHDSLRGDAGHDLMSGGGGNDTLIGGDGHDTLLGGGGADLLQGNAGLDTVSYDDATARVIVNLLNNSANAGQAAGDILYNIENLIGSNYNDVLDGSNAANHIRGGAGNDRISGRQGEDTLEGGAGADTIVFQAQDDITHVVGFQNDIDTIQASGFGATTYSQFQQYATQYADRVVFDLGSGDRLIVYGETISSLSNDFIFA